MKLVWQQLLEGTVRPLGSRELSCGSWPPAASGSGSCPSAPKFERVGGSFFSWFSSCAFPRDLHSVLLALRVRRFYICGFQPTGDGKCSGEKKIPESSKKQNLVLPHTGNYSHSIRMVLGIINDLECHIRDLSICGLCYQRSPGTSPPSY